MATAEADPLPDSSLLTEVKDAEQKVNDAEKKVQEAQQKAEDEEEKASKAFKKYSEEETESEARPLLFKSWESAVKGMGSAQKGVESAQAVLTALRKSLVARVVPPAGAAKRVEECNIKHPDNTANVEDVTGEGITLTLEGLQRNQRDINLLDKTDKRIITEGAIKLHRKFFENWKRKKLRTDVFCIVGSSGCGKSCAVTILAAQIKNRLKDVHLYYARDTYSRSSKWVDDVVAQHLMDSAKDEEAKSVVILDQLLPTERIAHFMSLGGTPGLMLVLVSSANCSQLRSISQGGQFSTDIIEFPFSASVKECLVLKEILVPAAGVGTDQAGRTPPVGLEAKWEYAEAVAFSEVTIPTTDFAERYEWTNGHFASMARIFKDGVEKTFERELGICQKALGAHKNVNFLLDVVEMIARRGVQISRERTDLRYVDKDGKVLSLFFLQVLVTAAATIPCPSQYFSPDNNQFFLSKNGAEAGWGVERAGLKNENLLRSATMVMAERGVTFPMDLTDVTRLPYKDINCIKTIIARAESSKDWGVHAIPLKWNETSIDGLQLYMVSGKLYIIGNSISVETAQVHSKSLRWITEIKKEMSGVEVEAFILLFTGDQAQPAVIKADNTDGLMLDNSVFIMDVCVVKSLDDGFMKSRYEGLQNFDGVRPLTVVKKGGCSCGKGKNKLNLCKDCICTDAGSCHTGCGCSINKGVTCANTPELREQRKQQKDMKRAGASLERSGKKRRKS